MQIGGRDEVHFWAHDFLWKRMNDSEIGKGFSSRVVVSALASSTLIIIQLSS
jgi:hypothetical protein